MYITHMFYIIYLYITYYIKLYIYKFDDIIQLKN